MKCLIVDLSNLLGKDAFQSHCNARDPVRASTGSESAYALSVPGLPRKLEVLWLQVPQNAGELPRFSDVQLTLVISAPGAFSRMSRLSQSLQSLKSPQLKFLLTPSAIMEKMWCDQNLSVLPPAWGHLTLPSSDPKDLWFIALEEINKIITDPALHDYLHETPSGEIPMANTLKQSLDAAMSIDGAMAAAIVDYRSGMCLAQAGSGLNLDLAAAGNTEVVRAKLKTIESLGLRRGIEDILITLVDQYHLIRLVPNAQGLFLYLVLDKSRGNLALARYKLTDIERGLSV